MSDLEHFRLKTNVLGPLTGFSIVLHAIPDAELIEGSAYRIGPYLRSW